MSDDPSRYRLGIEEPLTPIAVGAFLGLALVATVLAMFARACPLIEPLIDRDTLAHF